MKRDEVRQRSSSSLHNTHSLDVCVQRRTYRAESFESRAAVEWECNKVRLVSDR